MSVRYLDLADFVEIASEVTGLDLPTVVAMANLDLADSTLHAPSAGSGDEDLYPDFVEKCGVLRFVRERPETSGYQKSERKHTYW